MTRPGSTLEQRLLAAGVQPTPAAIALYYAAHRLADEVIKEAPRRPAKPTPSDKEPPQTS